MLKEDNFIKGYYNDDVYDVLPDGLIEITKEGWTYALENRSNKFVDGKFIQVSTPLTVEEIEQKNKILGVEIQNQMVCLNEANQNGLSSISTMIDKAVKLGKTDLVFPINISLETVESKAKLIVNNQTEFDEIFLTFGLARQVFFS